jgi:hypothetical protein
MPVVAVAKIILVITTLLMGIVTNEFIFSMFFFWISMSLQIFNIKKPAQIHFVIPTSDEWKKQLFLTKNFLVTCIYTLAILLDYVLMVHLHRNRIWDIEMVLVIVVTTIFSFYNFFIFRSFADGVFQFQFQSVTDKKVAFKESKDIFEWLEAGAIILSVFCILILITYKLDEKKYLQFLGTGYYRIGSLVVLVIIFLLLTSAVRRFCRNIKVGDYCG